MSSDPYGQAFGRAKAEIQQDETEAQSNKEATRAKWQAESEADSAKLIEIVQPELHKAADAMKKNGGTIETGGAVHSNKTNSPASIFFRVRDSGDWGRSSLYYDIRPQQGSVTITQTNSMDPFNKKRMQKVVSEEFGIKTRDDLTVQNMEKLILAAIEDYRASKPRKL